jgi:hypothetical protein
MVGRTSPYKSQIKLFACFGYKIKTVLSFVGYPWHHSVYIDRVALELRFETFFANALAISSGSPFYFHTDICYS